MTTRGSREPQRLTRFRLAGPAVLVVVNRTGKINVADQPSWIRHVCSVRAGSVLCYHATMPQASDIAPLFDRWVKLAVRVLERELEMSRAFDRHDTLAGDERETLVRNVLERILPPAYEVGRGELVDSDGTPSNQIDVVVARRDFPRLRFGDGSCQWPVEAVLATIEVKTELDASTLKEALDNCYSVGRLALHIADDDGARAAVARAGATLGAGGNITGPRYAVNRAELLCRPATFIYGFKGYSSRVADLGKCIATWAGDKGEIGLRHLPTFISAETCYSVRNDTGQILTDDGGAQFYPAMTLGKIEAPLHLMIRLLIRSIFRANPIGPNTDGASPSLSSYFPSIEDTDQKKRFIDFSPRALVPNLAQKQESPAIPRCYEPTGERLG